MRIMKTKVYKYEELSEDAKESAREWYVNGLEYFWKDDNSNVLEAFTDIFDFIKIGEWEYGYRNFINFSLDLDDTILELSGNRLAKWLYNNYYDQIIKGKYYHKNKTSRHSKVIMQQDCNLTGYYIDMDTLDPMFTFLDNQWHTWGIEDIIRKCLNNWIRACQQDYEAQFETECVEKTISCNEYEFTEAGKFIA